jgi:hypothetical protein
VGLGRELVYHLATRSAPILEGDDWEQIFARLIGARWKKSNVGLDDIVINQTAWGAKTVKNHQPAKAKKVRLISGRNSPIYSFGDSSVTKRNPAGLGKKILSIYNARVADAKKSYPNLRTIVLLKSSDLLEVAVFEMQTVAYDHKVYSWTWNKRKNLEGHCKLTGQHKFTWQPHGSQFTIVQEVPANRLAIRIKQPPAINKNLLLKSLKFQKSWVSILK